MSEGRFEKVTTQLNQPVLMRDGVTLYADIYRPDSDKKYPILLLRTPYNKSDAQTMNYAHPSWYARHGYVVIVQDTRGRWTSEGEFTPLVHEANDGYDTIEWAVTLPNVIPRVGLYGFSYVGLSQLLTAASKPPHLVSIAPFMCGSDDLRANDSGTFSLAQNLSWTLFVSQDIAIRKKRFDVVKALVTAPLSSLFAQLPLTNVSHIKNEFVPFYEDWLKPKQKNKEKPSLFEKIEVPALHLGGWYDIYADKTVKNFNELRARAANEQARKHQYLYMTPWFHMPWSRYVGELDFGEAAANRVDELQLKWFNRWLKEDESSWQEEHVHYFAMGEQSWKTAATWPPPQTKEKRLYLASEGRANSINGTGKLQQEISTSIYEEDVYVYHPSIPVPAIGGRSGPDPVQTPMGPKNQLAIEFRNDILVYTSEVLQQDVEVVGDVYVELYASTTARDTDFVAKLIDVYPDGRAINIAEGIIRASYRHPGEEPSPVEPGEIIQYHISLGPVGNVFKTGHAIRVDITSSLFPTFDRNPNDFIPLGEVEEQHFKTATQTIYHSSTYASAIVLPIVENR